MADENDFKVVDKRASRGAKDEPAAQGDGFVMKEAPKEPAHTLNEVDFSTLIFSLATGALIQMGIAPDPMTKKKSKNLDLARQNIDILTMLQTKTKGNLTNDEAKLMESLLAEIRLRFVEVSK